MKSVFPHRPGRILALLGFFVVAATLGFSGEKRVWVQYQSGAKGPVMAALAKANGRVHYEFDNLEAVAVSLPEQALNGISRNPHVTLVEEDPIRELHAQTIPYGVTMVQAPTAISNGGAGAGIIVGVIDSGAYAAHPDLPAGARLRGEPDLGANNQQTWYRDFSSHGTHVVGTIAAVNDNEGVVGVAPGVGGIYMVKVFGDTGQWVYSSTLLTAVQRAAQNGPAKVINMSLGGGRQSQTEKKGMDQLYNNGGVLLIASAGNAGDTTTSYPAGYASVMSVAAVDSGKALASFSQRNSSVEIAAPGVAVLSTTSYIANTTVSVGGDVLNAVPVEFAAYDTRTGVLVDGGFGGSQNAAWAGNVVLVQRGDGISFYDKVRNVQLSGGVACIIYNNLEEPLYATLGAGSSSTIPAVGLSQSQGNYLKANRLGQSTTVTSEFTQPAAGYDYFDGTSMAAPHVSGVAALIWSKYTNATNKQVRQALIESTEDLGAAGRDNSFGWGLVRANNAMTRLGELVGGGGGGPDTTPPVISNVSTATSKGKPGAQGSFTVSFTTNEPATSVVSIPDLGSNGTKTTSLGTSHTVTFQGVKGATYSGTITATDAATNASSAPFTRNN